MSAADDSLGQAWFGAFSLGLQQFCWESGRNVQIDVRWGGGDTERFRRYAMELVTLAPDVLVGTANSIVGDLQQASPVIPIVMVLTIDPVGSGLVASLAHSTSVDLSDGRPGHIDLIGYDHYYKFCSMDLEPSGCSKQRL
jgi:ABC-type uncharacterized transport system substrate-binding protein